LLHLSFELTEINEISVMKNEIDKKLTDKNIKPTAMRELVLQVLNEQNSAISLPELEKKFNKVDKVTLYSMILPFFQQPGLVTKFSCFHCKPLFGIESGSVKGGDPRSRLYTLDGFRINPDLC